MNIIFFGDAGEDCNAYAYIQKILYFHALLIKIIFFHFLPKEKISYLLEKINTIFPEITKKIVFSREFPGKIIFLENLKKILYFQVFFWERSSFLLCLKNKIIFLGKRNIIFPDNTRKIIFQCDFFGKTIFAKHLKKGNIVFCAVYNFLLSHSLWSKCECPWLSHSHKKQKDSLEDSMAVLFVTELKLLIMLVARLSRNTSNVNTECAGK